MPVYCPLTLTRVIPEPVAIIYVEIDHLCVGCMQILRIPVEDYVQSPNAMI